MSRGVWLLLVGIAGITACSPTDGRQAREMAEDAVWATVSEAPVLELGTDPADPDRQFDRITGVARLSDGRIVVADRSRRLRFFDAEGRLLGVEKDALDVEAVALYRLRRGRGRDTGRNEG
ncbi:MAG TPA: hypothetical protein VF212_01460 [Longimicrobiales bacterium]